MSVLLLAAAATLLAPPQAASGVELYPLDAVEKRQSAAAQIGLTVDPKGNATRCEAGQTYGNAQLAAAICPILLHAANKPARSHSGTPMWGVAHTIYRFYIPGSSEGATVAAVKETPSGQLAVNRLPGGASSIAVKVVVSLDADGNVTDCAAGPKETQMALVDAVCAQPAALAREPLTIASGRQVPYVTDLLIELVTPATAAKP